MLAALWAARELRRTGPLRNSWWLLSYGRGLSSNARTMLLSWGVLPFGSL
jgi:hypothetical protein